MNLNRTKGLMTTSINQHKLLQTNTNIQMPYFLFFDLETTGLLRGKPWELSYSKPEQFPNIVQISWELWYYPSNTTGYQLRNKSPKCILEQDFIVKPEGYTIPGESSAIHGITQEQAERYGVPIDTILPIFYHYLIEYPNTYIVAHNASFDLTVLLYHKYRYYKRYDIPLPQLYIPYICTMMDTTEMCEILHANPRHPRDFKYPKLGELYKHLFGKTPENLHNSKWDVKCMIECFHYLYSNQGKQVFQIRNMGFLNRT
jgi:DNA polymerase III epsilon subunit-like protein